MINYKKIIRNREVRIKVLQILNWIPDKLMLSLQYRIKTGRWINWENPKRFTEKLQLYKILSKDNYLMAQCADKFDVRSFVKDRGLSDILIPLVGKGVYSSAKEIDWENFPNQFVIKDTLGCGGNSVIICTDKELLNKKVVLKRCSEWIKYKYKHPGREHVYDKNKHRIIIEEYLDSSSESEGLVDYKFFCFDGKPTFIYVISNRSLGKGAELGIYDLDFNILPYTREDELAPTRSIDKPINFDRMIEISQILSKGFPEVRIDLYNIGGKIFFGEMTFFDGSGYMTFKPDIFDFLLGEPFDIHLG